MGRRHPHRRRSTAPKGHDVGAHAPNAQALLAAPCSNSLPAKITYGTVTKNTPWAPSKAARSCATSIASATTTSAPFPASTLASAGAHARSRRRRKPSQQTRRRYQFTECTELPSTEQMPRADLQPTCRVDMACLLSSYAHAAEGAQGALTCQGTGHGHKTGSTPQSAHSLPASRTRALTANCPVCSNDLTTELPCLLVACTTTMTGLTLAMVAHHTADRLRKDAHKAYVKERTRHD